jgi:hypothetical protein
MGKVTTEIELINHVDSVSGAAVPRKTRINNAIVDSGAILLALSTRIIDILGLKKTGKSKVNVATGIVQLGIYSAVDLEIQSRKGVFEVMELRHPKIGAVVGEIPLERLDFLIHPGINRLIPNPEHDNQLVLDQLLTEDLF